ncbi:MAG: hypothetical protein ABI851_02975 [Saprospiraceae bacterium]
MRLFLVFISILSLLLTDCSEDFRLTEPWKDIPVVYGFINRSDTAQYIRVEKLFVDEDISATILAKNPDSVYYKDAVVKLFNITKNKEYTLNKVDLVVEGYTRSEGDFGVSPNYMYKILTKNIILNGNDSLEFKLERGNNLPVVTSRIKLIKDFQIISPDNTIRELTFKEGFSQSFSWEKTPEAGVYNFTILINILETDRSINKTTLKTLKWVLLSDALDNRVNVSGDNFYSFLQQNLIADNKYDRELVDLQLFVRAGGKELKSFNELVNANTGITASQEIPRFTNLSEGFGLFANIHDVHKTYGFSPDTKKGVLDSELTKLLRFK